MKEATNTQRLTRELRQTPWERPIHLKWVLYRSKRNQSAIFVDPGDEECQGDGANTKIGEEVERKNELNNGDVTTATNRISPQKTLRCPARAVTCNFCKKSRAL